MPCPHCAATTTTELTKKPQLGYRIFRCSACQRQFNERTGTPYNYLEFPTDIVLLVVLWRLRYKLSLRDLAEMFGERGFAFTHEAVRAWEARFAPLLADKLRAKRRGQVGRSWHVDETYIKVGGVWKYLYRAIDRAGNLVDSRLSDHRDMDAAKRFFRGALEIAEHTPERVTTDGHDSYPRAIRETLGEAVTHRCNPYLNNRIEQDHRGVKQRYYPMRGFGNVDSAACFCRTFDEQRQNLPRPHDDVPTGPITGGATTRVLCSVSVADGRIASCLTNHLYSQPPPDAWSSIYAQRVLTQPARGHVGKQVPPFVPLTHQLGFLVPTATRPTHRHRDAFAVTTHGKRARTRHQRRNVLSHLITDALHPRHKISEVGYHTGVLQHR